MKKIIVIFSIIFICIAAFVCYANKEKNAEDVNMKGSDVNMKRSYVNELKIEFNSSGTPKYIVDEALKEEFEQRLGRSLPDDYYEFLNAFGHANFGDYLTVADPFIPNGIESYFESFDFCKHWYYDAKSILDIGAKAIKDENGDMKIISDPNNLLNNIDPNEKKRNDVVYEKLLCIGFGYPYDFLKNDSGLVFWGETDDCQFYWNFSGSDYTIVVFCDDEYYEYDMSFSEFLYHYLNGNIIDFEFDTDEEPYLYRELE